MSTTTPGELDELAAKINAAHTAHEAASRASLEHARDCGRLLIEARKSVPRGQWLIWIRGNVACSTRMAQLYVWVANNWSEVETQCAMVAHLTIGRAIKLVQVARQVAPIDEPEAPTPYDVQLTEYFRRQFAESAKWQARRDQWRKLKQAADELHEQADELKDKARQAAQKAESAKHRIEREIQAEFDRASAAAGQDP